MAHSNKPLALPPLLSIQQVQLCPVLRLCLRKSVSISKHAAVIQAFRLFHFLGCLSFQQCSKYISGTDLCRRKWSYTVAVCYTVAGCSPSQEQTCLDTETEVADQTCYLTQSLYTDSGPTSPSQEDPTHHLQSAH